MTIPTPKVFFRDMDSIETIAQQELAVAVKLFDSAAKTEIYPCFCIQWHSLQAIVPINDVSDQHYVRIRAG